MKVEQIDAFRWRIPREGQMRVDGIVYADAAMMAGRLASSKGEPRDGARRPIIERAAC